ncbi:MAG: arylamine N-acetyltransferase [Hydrogenophilaceae bacterium]|jgi:N-hydroxyarylamine O-acetyltransferase|nr:arylamine N-acetyltransferase [Hydrogenophilaceae bacterium]
MQLSAYFERIGFSGEARPDLATLKRLHRAHLASIPYENLDVLLKRPLDLDPARIFDKLVTRRRGGWCYEMNGLLGWALDEIGFSVTRLAGAVARDTRGDSIIGNHLVLLVDLDDGRVIADVGFGDGLVEPVPLAEGEIVQDGFVSRLGRIEDGWWRYTNHQNGGAPNFDFRPEPADPAVLAARCAFLQTSEISPFTQNVVLQRRLSDRVEVMRNSLRLTVRPDRVEERVIASADEYVAEVRGAFGIDEPAARVLWPLAERRGREMLAERA